MTRSQKITKKYISVPTVVSSFAGMIMAVPFAFALSSPANSASAAQTAQTATAQVTTADFAKYAYAFNQGYDARVASTSTGSSTTCAEVSVATPGSGGDVTVAAAVTPAKPAGKGGVASKPAAPDQRMASMINSYNTYTSMIYNSSSVANTNSNNNVGSNNTTKTEVKIEDSKGVMVGVSNDPLATQNVANDSFNKDSYNTKTDTKIVNDSFNKETNLAINSGNTSTKTETTNVNKTETNTIGSNNTKTEDSNNSMSNELNMTNEVTKIENKAIDSFNTTTVDTTINPAPQDLEQPV